MNGEGKLMKKIIKSIISNEAPKDNADKFIKCYEDLKEESNNFEDLVYDGKIKLNYKTEKTFYDFLFVFNDLFPYMDTKKLEEEINLSDYDREASFFKIVFQYLAFNKIVKRQTDFLRRLKTDEFEDLIERTYNNYVLNNSVIKNYKKWNTDEINVVRKSINTILSYMINAFESTTTAFSDAKMRFDFTKAQFDFIWKLCERDKMYLMLKNITEKLNNGNC